jgi:elongator complex protein 5
MPVHAVDTTMDVSFNLSLTDDQKRRRDAVPLPYVHEGEGIDMGDDDGDDDDE